jgi:hypothetical protein
MGSWGLGANHQITKWFKDGGLTEGKPIQEHVA